MTAPAPSWVAGVDGCPGGWMVVCHPLDAPDAARWRILPDFAAVLGLPERPALIAVDIPVGLPERVTAGGRQADIEARANLGARQSAVFAVPARAAVMYSDYREACAAALTRSDPPRKVSRQTFNLFPKIREVDVLMTSALQRRVREAHPELAFWAMNGERPVGEPKKVKSQLHGPGLALRRRLLARAGYRTELLEADVGPRRIAGPDDLLDAAAIAWTAGRILSGTARRFPATPPADAKGLLMEIWG